MSDHNNNYNDNSFNLAQAYSYTLLLQVETTSFSYAVVHQNKLLVSSQNCDLNELSQPNQLSDLLSATYQKVVIGLPATGLTLVPNNLFSENYAADFARFLDVKDHEKALAQTLDERNAIIYKTSASLVNAVEKFGIQNTVYAAKGWIKAIEKSDPPADTLYLEIGNATVQILYIYSGALRFYNTFDFKTTDELAYFTTFVSEELNLKPQNTNLVVSGDVNVGDKHMSRLTDFYSKVELNDLKILELPGQISAHKILALAALSLCASSEEA